MEERTTEVGEEFFDGSFCREFPPEPGTFRGCKVGFNLGYPCVEVRAGRPAGAKHLKGQLMGILFAVSRPVCLSSLSVLEQYRPLLLLLVAVRHGAGLLR